MNENSGAEVTLLEGDDGFLVLGSEAELTAWDAEPALKGRTLSPQALGKVGGLLKGAEVAAAESGRWFRADAASHAYMKANKVTGVTSGVLRGKNLRGFTGNKGVIVKHLKFEHAGLASPAAPAVLAAMAMQQALQASLADITAYLEVIDEKLDVLLKQRKVETLGQLGGVAWTIDEAGVMFDETGRISAVTWSKVQANSLALATMQAECIAQLNALAHSIKTASSDVDGLARVMRASREDFTFWVGVLARTIRLQDKQYVLELAHVEDAEPAELDDHRRGISVARRARHERIVQALSALAASLRETSALSNLQRVANPFSSQTISTSAQGLTDELVRFIEQAELGEIDLDQLSASSWSGAVKGLFDETTTHVTASGAKVTGRARLFTGGLQARGEKMLLEQAERIKARQGSDGEAATEVREDPPAN